MFNPKVIKQIVLISQIGISMIVPVLMMMWVGLWVEEQFDLSFVLFFILFGVAAGFRNCYQLIRKYRKEKS